jgi:hypothetical protein
MSLSIGNPFTPAHIEANRHAAPAPLAELAAHCLELVAELVHAGLRYQFKGGNSLLVLLENPQRFSIDVDIATDESRERIEECVDRAVKEHGVFTRWEKRRHKTKPWLPISSYHVYFKPCMSDDAEVSVMLDAQLRRSPYKTFWKPVRCATLYQSTVECELPVPAGIVGDKLLTLGPSTLGIPVGKNKEAQRLKHVFDVSTLLTQNPALSDARASFLACIHHECEIQGREIPVETILADTLAFCATTARHAGKPDPATVTDPVLKENAVGLEPFADHLFSKDYTWTRLQRDAARVALCITAVSRDTVSDAQFAKALADCETVTSGTRPPHPGLAGGPEAAFCWSTVRTWLGTDPLA